MNDERHHLPIVSTLTKTIVADSSGRRLQYGCGEPIRVSDGQPWDARKVCRESLLAFYHLTDIHLTDTGTGRSVEMVRQLDAGDGELGRVYRPWAPFTGAVLIAAVKAMTALKESPLTGRSVDLAVLGGDFINNSQMNELSAFVSVLQGQRLNPFKRVFTLHGTRFTYEPARYLTSGSGAEQQRGSACRLGSMPLYKAASTPMLGAQELPYPCLFVLGNHDLEALGHFAHNWYLSLWAFQPFKLMAKTPIQVPDIARLSACLQSERMSVRAKARREIVRRLWQMRRNLALSWSGFDFGRQAVTIEKSMQMLLPLVRNLPIESAGPAYYVSRPRPGIAFIMLDSTSRGGGAEGHITDRQFAWLKSQLARAEMNRELAVVVSHHASSELTEPRRDPEEAGPVHLGVEFVKLLLNSKAVIAHLAGHTHRNRIMFHRHEQDQQRGYWEINTCSLVDWPQQLRFLELVRNSDGTLSLISFMVNHMALPDPGCIDVPTGLKDLPEECVVLLASFARKLSYRDFLLGHAGPLGSQAPGSVSDRNVELIIKDPYA